MRDHADDATLSYLNGLFGTEQPFQQRICTSAPEKLRGMMLSPYEGALLSWLASSIGAKCILEIGSFVGYSASWLLRILPEDGQLHCIESDPRHATLLTDNLSHPLDTKRVALHVGDARDVLPHLSSLGPFDMVFIDADKRSTHEYLMWAERHVRPGGLVAVDNTLRFGSVEVASAIAPEDARAAAGRDAVRRVNAYLAGSPAWRAILLPTPGGLTVGIKNY